MEKVSGITRGLRPGGKSWLKWAHWQCHINYEARASGLLQSKGANMKAGIQYSYGLPTHYDCCPTFNAEPD